MCCCAKPNVNGQPGYSWDGKIEGIRPIDAPVLAENDVLLFDEPGRCGGLDSHCHHYRVVKGMTLLVQHGGGCERVRLSLPRGFSFDAVDSNTRYWLLNALYHAHASGKRDGHNNASQEYRTAFAEGRLKKRKMPGRDAVEIWIEPKRNHLVG